MRRLVVLLLALTVVGGCGGADGSGDAPPTTAPAAVTGDSVTISEFPAELRLRPEQEIRARLVGVNPRNGTVSKPTSTKPGVVHVSRLKGSSDTMTVLLRAGATGDSVVAWTSTPLCDCDGPAIPLRIDVQVADDAA